MSFAALFGNIDEKGRLDSDLDEDLKETLQHVDPDVISKIFNTETFGLHQESKQNEDELESSLDREQLQPTAHDKDAVDYSDFNETIPDDQMFSDKNYRRGMAIVQKSMPRSRLSMVSDNYDEEDEDEPEAEPTTTTLSEQSPSSQSNQAPGSATAVANGDLRPEPVSRSLDIKQVYPGFEKGKIPKFTELMYMPNLSRRPKLQLQKKVVYSGGLEYEIERDDMSLFNKPGKMDRIRTDIGKLPFKRRKLEATSQMESAVSSESESEDDTLVGGNIDKSTISIAPPLDIENDTLYHSIMLDKWEDKISWESGDESMEGYESEDADDPVVSKHLSRALYDGSWVNAIMWDKEQPDSSSLKIALDLNDPHMLFDCEEVKATKAHFSEPKQVKKGRKPLPRAVIKTPIIYTDTEPRSLLPLNRFNASNDAAYSNRHIGVVRVQKTFGQLEVHHALPALKLHPILYKTKLSKAELRSFHRPLLQLPTGTDIQFSRVKIGKKKKKDKKKGYSDAMRTTKDLSLKDSSPFVLLEYSEEHPYIISNTGMGTLIINYYRKTEPKDEHVPLTDIGEPFVLDIGDTSPFMNFGNVEPGQTIPVLYNNLIRAPLFRHDVKQTDFLFVKSTYKGHTKYYIREIPAIFLLGQTYPVQEVPGPHSRKVTNTIKFRLQVVAYRLIKKNPLQRLKMSKLAQKFPEYSDIQIRQRLKEFLEFHRRNKDGGGGYWKTRDELPNEEELRSKVTPEMVCLYQSMLVGERHLQDLGYGDVNDDDDGSGETDSKLEVEQQLAPWFATRNFINASQNKAMLKLHGTGDPTGRDEGFSFIRVSMKDIFLRKGESAKDKIAQIEAKPKSAHKYNVSEQKQIYQEEIDRIWNSQLKALTDKNEPVLSDHETEEESGDEAASPSASEPEWNGRRPSTPLYGNRRYARAPSESVDDDDVSVTGSMSSRTSYHVNNTNNHLAIRRLIRQKNGEKIWQQEIVENPVVIKSYLRQRQMIEEEATRAEVLEPTDDAEKNARMKKRIQDQLAKLKRNAERRQQRQQKKMGNPESSVLGCIRGKPEGAMRKCGNCGQIGHMKTNKNCPMFNVVNNPNNNPNNTDAATDANKKPLEEV